VRITVLSEYFRMLEDGEIPTQADVARRAGVSDHAVGRVLRWAESRGLPVLADSRRGRHADADPETVRDMLVSLRSKAEGPSE
tara:strand:- start:8801 stop:9049 length:249 start_codon:yes stop_codon:yes gene_type:complete